MTPHTDINQSIGTLLQKPINERNPEDIASIKRLIQDERENLARLESIVNLLGGGPIRTTEPEEPQVRKRIPAPDGKTHAQAIMDVLANSDGMTSGELRTALTEAQHPMDSGTLGTTLSNLFTDKRITKKQNPKSKGKQRKTYIYKVA